VCISRKIMQKIIMEHEREEKEDECIARKEKLNLKR
jgi:hypothetical protein